MSSARPTFMTRIDQALAGRQSLAELLESGLQRVYSRTNKKSKRLLSRLRNASSTEELFASPDASYLLPVLLRHSENDLPGLRRDTETLLRAQSLPAKSWTNFVSYPVVVLFVAIALFLLQAYWISPLFERMFDEFELRLPAPTLLVFSVNKWTRNYIFFLAIALFVGFTLWGSIKVFGAALIDRLQSIPVVGWIASGNRRNLLAMSRFLQTLAELLQTGANVPEAIRIAADASQHDLLRRNANLLIHTIESEQVAADGLPHYLEIPYPPLLIQVLRSEKSFESMNFLRAMAETYRERAESFYANKEQAASPWMILFIGAMTFLLTMALFLPLVSLVTSLA